MTMTPGEIVALRAALVVAEARADALEIKAATAEAEAARVTARASSTEALIAHLKLEIEKLRRELYGSRSERRVRLLAQMELQLEVLATTATEDELAAERAATSTTTVKTFQRKVPSRQPFPDHLPRERVVIAAPTSCGCCGSDRVSKLGEDITETLEVIPRRWKLNNVDPQGWLADVLARIAEMPQSRLDTLLPWNWKPETARLAA